ncbi:MAG: CDP-alcohol phosphatidyltransferase family protein [Bacteroidales bacterium]|nr:CDP-alcohol phosphatidyltransferase family protein [Bacteroidales bacterium]
MSGIISKLKFVPSMLTCSSALCGIMATFLALDGEKSLVYASYLILIASVFDFSDGFAARLLNAKSELGKQLDSLADAVSFGVAPTAIMFALMKHALKVNGSFINFEGWQIAILISCTIIVICSILRLAKFNIDPEQSYGFKGLATPANAILIASIPLINAMNPEDFWIYSFAHALFDVSFPFSATLALIALQVFVFDNIWWLLPICIIFSLMMVTNVPMFSLKMKSYKYQDNKLVYNFLIFAVIMLLIIQWIAVPFIILGYVLVSVIKWICTKKNK